jgi:endoglucanase
VFVYSKRQAALPSEIKFYVPKPNEGAVIQSAALSANADKDSAALIQKMVKIPHAVWFTGGSPSGVQQDVKNTVALAAAGPTVPILVAYNLPFRDCSQYSAGGAASKADYKAWIDGFAAGIGDARVLVILEPDGLGIIPWYKQFRGLAAQAAAYDWCQPAKAPEASAANDRFEILSYAVKTLKAHPNTSVYLDGTNNAWLGAGDISQRLVLAGVENADGFFLNVSNFQSLERLQKYGTWVSKCIWFGAKSGPGVGRFDLCASQYAPANPNDFSTWGLTDAWYDKNTGSASQTTGASVLKHFVIDTSRNGQGPWTPPNHPTGDAQDWCNPPGRGLGLLPTANTGVELVDAYLWIKIPGESDGQCYRWTSGPLDPVRAAADPPAGQWFDNMALELAKNAKPPLP